LLSTWSGVHFPHGMAVHSEDTVYISDSSGVRKFSPNGDLLADWTGSGQFGDHYGLTVDADGTLYVADTDKGALPRCRLPASHKPNGAAKAKPSAS
jgi:hypothetical protein